VSSRKEEKARLREERLAREREAAAAERRRRLVGYAVGGALAAAAVIAIAVVVLAGGGDGGAGGSGGGAEPTSQGWPEGSVPKQSLTDLEGAAQLGGCATNDHRAEGNNHVEEPVAYRTNPPSSGDHNPVPADDGAYLTAPETEALVHSLEHGRIIVQFKPSVGDDVKGKLKALFDEDPAHMILVPNETGMPYAVAATAWTHSLTCPAFDDDVFDAIRTFKTAYRDRGPEFVP
jgi:hypothetical protein